MTRFMFLKFIFVSRYKQIVKITTTAFFRHPAG